MDNRKRKELDQIFNKYGIKEIKEVETKKKFLKRVEFLK